MSFGVGSGSRVQNLFHSVQLNVNNPHFLIMQGRITKACAPDPLHRRCLCLSVSQTDSCIATG